MGFYGNISNATRTQFTFDRVYPSRKAMQDAQTVDGVYVGRYVLVEYDSDVHCDYYERVYMVNGELYRTKEAQDKDKLTVSNTSKSQVVRVEPDGYPDNHSGTTQFYLLDHVNGVLKIEEIAGNDSNYSSNYNVDLRAFYGEGGGRGYDSTVWQKVYTEGIEKYVMVAELNTVVPTFDITADAPTMAPRLPHFDADSTNVYYKVHWQPQWGMRVKGAQSYKTPKLNDDGTDYLSAGEGTLVTIDSSDDIIYPSDYSTKWTRHEYDRVSGNAPTYYATVDENNNLAWSSQEEYSEVPAAVYFNKAGFDSEKITYSRHYDGDNETTTNYEDYNSIVIEPTGRSGHRYSTHIPGKEHECEIDIQELSVMLPGIGDSVAKLWDIVYGDETVNHGRKRNQDIKWDSVEGIRMVSTNHGYDAEGNIIQTNGFTYNKDGHISTLAGCINSVHDLMGMIIQNPATEDWDKYQKAETGFTNFADNLIYYYSGAYYRKKKDFVFHELTQDKYNFIQVALGPDTYQADTYYFKSGNSYVKDTLGVVKTEDEQKTTPYYERRLKVKGDFKPVTFTHTYAPGKWYTKGNDDTYTLSLEEYINPDEIYYTINPGEKIEISNDFVGNKYFRKEKRTDKHDFAPITGYERDENNKFKLDEEGKRIPIYGDKIECVHEVQDFMLDRQSQASPGTSYFDVTFKEVDPTEGGAYFIYEPGKFFYDPNLENKETEYALDNSLHPVEGRTYLYGEVKGSSTSTYTVWDDATQAFKIVELEIFEFENPPYEVNVIDINNYKIPRQIIEEGIPKVDAEGNPVYETDKDGKVILYKTDLYIPIPVTLTEEELESEIELDPSLVDWKKLSFVPLDYEGPYYMIDTIEEIESFYSYGQFWYVDNSDIHNPPLTYRVDYSPSSKSDRTYYKITATPIAADEGKELVYKPGEYYYKNDLDEYVLDYSPGPQAGEDYYTNAFFYVYSDKFNLFGVGSLWNVNVPVIPSSVELATRGTKYIMQPLHGFARTLNTIHGLILKVNDLLEVNDSKTRDLATVQGCINNVKDIITKFGELKPQEFVVVDNYGRIHGSDFSTLQTQNSISSVKNNYQTDEEYLLKNTDHDQFKEVASKELMRKQWITAHINGNVDNPFLTIHHNFQKVTDTTSTTNKNIDNIASTKVSDKITLYTPIVDAMGHVVGKNTETVTLPYGFKTITTNGRGSNNVENAKGTPTTPEVVAEDTQDTLAINSGNKWIRIDSNNTNDSLTIYHDVHDISTSTSNASLSSETAVTTFNVPTYTFDGAGHYVSHDTKTLTMPFGYGKITGDVGATAATATFDTLAFGSDNWLTATISQDKVTYTHDFTAVTNTTSTSDKNDHGDTINLYTPIVDAKGHVVGKNIETVTLPYGYKKFEDSNSTPGTSTASNTQDTFVFKGDTWITPTVTNDLLTIVHNDPSAAVGYTERNNGSLNFGDGVVIDDWGFDSKGHKKTGRTRTMTLPTLELTNSGSGNVVTSVSIANNTASNGKIITHNLINAGSLVLNTALGTSNSKVANTDTISAAIGKLQAQINGMDVSDGSSTGKYVSSVSQTDGKISVGYTDLPQSISPTQEFTYESGVALETDPKTIEWLFKKVADLEAKIVALETQLNPTV